MKKPVVVVVLLVCLVTLFAITATPASATVFPPKSPGYWMNHPGAWLGGVEIGGVWYTAAQAIPLMKAPTAGDKRYSVFQVLAAAEQNQAHGAGPYWEGSMQAFMTRFGPLPGGVPVSAKSAAFQSIEPAYLETCAWWD